MHSNCVYFNMTYMKFRIHYLFYILSIAMVSVLSSCNDDDIVTDPTEGLTKISEGYALGAAAKVELWAKDALITGYNQVFVAVYDSVSGHRITDAHIHFHPEMTMTGMAMTHGTYFEDPEEEPVNQIFPGAIAFVMPSGDMGSWELEIHLHNHHNDKEGQATFDITVADPASPTIKSFVTDGGDKIFVASYFPEEQKVGINKYELIAFRKDGDFAFNPVDDFTFTLEPEMPSMGHGSPNNVNPVFTSTHGHYAGKVNFTMTGGWRLNLDLNQNSTLLQELYFDVVLE